ncbi:MAG TPA: hypothetical protein PK559_03355 [Ignavibacteriaceae bacterium]|nr:hypothetical protein [Ignavibacteriaceae bacterium]
MAELKNRFFGEVTGAFGDVVYRVRKGKNFTARKPKQYKKQQTEQYIKRTNTFRMSIKLSSMINSVPELHNFLKTGIVTNQSPYEYLLSRSMKGLFNKSSIERFPITPEKGFGVEIDETVFDGKLLTFRIKPLLSSSMIDTSIEKKFKLISIIQAIEPNTEIDAPYSFLKLQSESIVSSVEDNLEFTLNLSTADKQLMELYNTYVTNSTIITYDENDNPLKYSNTMYTTIQKT